MTFKCFKCNQEIVFDANQIGKNRKKIPLDPTTQLPHDCPMREKKTASTAQKGEFVHVGVVEDPIPPSHLKAVKELGRRLEERDEDEHWTEDKDDHGNEDPISPKEYVERLGYVDHTTAAKGQSKVKIFEDEDRQVVEEDYNKFLAENNGKIKTQGAQFQIDQVLGFAIALYYEEVAKQ